MNTNCPIESVVERKLRDYVVKAGGLCMKLTPIAMVGIPDRLVILPNGRIIFVEVKRDHGSLSQSQVYCHKLLESLGCEVRVLFGEGEVWNFAKEEGLLHPELNEMDYDTAIQLYRESQRLRAHDEEWLHL